MRFWAALSGIGQFTGWCGRTPRRGLARWCLDYHLDLGEDLIVGIAKLFGADNTFIASIKGWFETAKASFQTGWDDLLGVVNNFKDDIKKAVDAIIGFFSDITNFDLNIDWSSVLPKFPDLNGDGDPGFASGAIVSNQLVPG